MVSDRFSLFSPSLKTGLSKPRPWLSLLAFCLLGTLVSTAQTATQVATFIEATQAMQQGNLEAAAAGFSAVVKQMPTVAEAHFELSQVSKEQGQVDDAIASLKKA